jgi:hypothetical protein
MRDGFRTLMRGIFQVRLLFIIEVRSLTPQQATGHALAVPVQPVIPEG